MHRDSAPLLSNESHLSRETFPARFHVPLAKTKDSLSIRTVLIRVFAGHSSVFMGTPKMFLSDYAPKAWFLVSRHRYESKNTLE